MIRMYTLPLVPPTIPHLPHHLSTRLVELSTRQETQEVEQITQSDRKTQNRGALESREQPQENHTLRALETHLKVQRFRAQLQPEPPRHRRQPVDRGQPSRSPDRERT